MYNHGERERVQRLPVQFLASASPDLLTAALVGRESATVEAEYGDAVVAGSVMTMAHHGPRAGQRAPCAYGGACDVCGGMGGATGGGPDHGYDPSSPCHAGPYVGGLEVVGLSHVDLDTLGGCAALMGVKPDWPLFWQAAEFVDLNGPHKLDGWLYRHHFWKREGIGAAIRAFWAWSESHRVMVPRDGVADVTDAVMAGVRAITAIVAEGLALEKWRAREPDICRGMSWSGDSIGESLDDARTEAWEAERPVTPYHDAGYAWSDARESLERESCVQVYGADDKRVVLRQAPSFVNHLYEVSRVAGTAAAVVGFNTTTGAITVSLADPVPGFSCREFVQSIWGPLAGGHDGIAGSPRGAAYTLDDARTAAEALTAAIGAVL